MGGGGGGGVREMLENVVKRSELCTPENSAIQRLSIIIISSSSSMVPVDVSTMCTHLLCGKGAWRHSET